MSSTTSTSYITISLSIPHERAIKLRKLAEEAGVTPEELLQTRLDEWLTGTETEFREAAAYILRKNAELYRRLA